jgi:predicted O-methyltransferase YrrM
MSLSQTNSLGRHLYSKWSPVIDQGRHIYALTGDGELAYLAELASKSELAIEQGVYMGSSAFVQLTASQRLHMWCVDPFMVAGTKKCTEYFLRQFISEGRCELIPKFTPEAGAQLEHLKGRLDYVFIDGSHNYDDVLVDIDTWIPMIRPGGLLCGHDYEMGGDGVYNGVARAVQQKLVGHFQPVPNMFAWIKP